MGLGPGGLFLLSRMSLAELLRLFAPGVGIVRCGPPPYGPGDIERCPRDGPGDMAQGARLAGPGDPAGDDGRWTGRAARPEGDPLGPGVRALLGRGFTGRVDRHVRGATPC